MASENTQDAPFGILLISTFWIFVGIWFLSMLSSNRYYTAFSSISIFFGIFFILLGWGLLTLKKWAYYISMILSLLALIPLLFAVPFLIYSLFSGYFYSGIMALIYIPFIPMAWYLFRNKELFVKKPKGDNERACPNCSRVIPLDAVVCPYCGKILREISNK